MAKETADAPASAPLPGEKAGGKKKGTSKLLLIIIVAVVALGVGGGAAYWLLGRGPAESAEEETTDSESPKEGAKKKAKEPEAEPGMLAFEPFLVNLADPGGQAYLRVALSLLVGSEEEAKALEAKTVVKTRLRSAILEVLSTQAAVTISTAEGKAELKKAIVEKIETLELDTEVSDVLFSDFVVQY